MLKNKKTKILLSLLLIITLITPFSFADDEESAVANENIEATTEEVVNEDNSQENPEEVQNSVGKDIYQGDLYLFEDNITMDKLVDGNVYIFGNNVKVTGQVAGNLFVMANKVTFEDAYIESSTYILANEVYFKAVSSDLYVACNTLEIPTDYGVYRDLKCAGNSISIVGIIGRNANIECTTLSLEKDGAKADIYGNLEYSSATEITVPEGAIQGNVKYSPIAENTKTKDTVLDYIFSAITAIVFALVIYGLALLFTKDSIEKCTKITSNKFLPAFGIGLLALIIVPIVSILLMISVIGLPVAFTLLALYGLLIAISTSVFAICISNIICNKLNKTNKWLTALFVAIISLLIYILGIIPYIGFLKLLLVILGFGIITMCILFKNIKFEKATK